MITTGDYFEKYFCYACGGFIAKFHTSKLQPNSRVSLTIRCCNNRCKQDNIIHLEKGIVSVKRPVDFHYDLPRIIYDIQHEEDLK